MTRRNFVTVLVLLALAGDGIWRTAGKNYDDALTKCILFFEGQRSGKLPSSQRITWRKDSALHDGSNIHVDLTGGYYDAGDNVKFSFPMAFTTTVLAWGVIEFGQYMGSDRGHALEAVRWGADYFLKATSVPGTVVAQVGDPYSDHDCWERPEDMDTLRTPYLVNQSHPGSEVAAEIAAALAATSIAFKNVDSSYSKTLLQRARKVFEFADKHRGSYDSSVGNAVCPFYCDFNGYMDELVWGAAWLYRATQDSVYWKYIKSNLNNLASKITRRFNGSNYVGGSFAEFGWDSKHAGINILLSRLVKKSDHSYPFVLNADKFVCSILPESPSRSVTYSPGGLLFKPGPSNLQHGTALSFLLVVYATYLEAAHRVVHCDNNVVAIPSRLVDIARGQADYILGKNPSSMSYMVGYGNKYPQRIHHRGSVLPSVDKHPKHFGCQDGHPYFESSGPNQNVLVGAIVGGPDENDQFADTRLNVSQSEPATYINAPFVGVLAYLKGLSYHINRH